MIRWQRTIRRRALLATTAAVPFLGAATTQQKLLLSGAPPSNVPPGATLDLAFSGPTLDPSLTFTRASTATYFDSSGVMRTTAMNMVPNGNASGAVVSGALPTGWVESNNTGIPPVVAGVGTEGGIPYVDLRFQGTTTGTANNIFIANNTIAGGNNQAWTVSVYLRVVAGSIPASSVSLLGSDNIAPHYGSPITPTGAPLSTQRYTNSYTTSSSGVTTQSVIVQLGLPAATAVNFTLRIGGVQLETGTTATAYIPTTTAASGAPRFDCDPVTHAALGLLIEEARTNVWLQSADASNAAWSKAGVTAAAPTVTANQGVAPDGVAAAARVAYPAVSGAGALSVMLQGVIATAAAYTFSVYLRGNAGGEQTYVYLTDGGAAYPARQRVTLTTAWQRFVVSATLTAAAWYGGVGTDLRDAGQSSTSAGTMFVWGAQIEQGVFPTSYIPTTGAAVTRSADQCSILPAQMGFYTPPGGSWMAEFIDLDPANNPSAVIATHNGINGSLPLYADPTLHLNQYDGAVVMTSANFFALGAVAKGATTWVSGTGQVCLNGGAIASAALSSGYPALATNGIDLLRTSEVSPNQMSAGYIRRVRYWPRVLSNTELQAVTT